MRSIKFMLLIFVGLIVSISYSNASSVSGVYVRKTDIDILFMQLVITPDSKVSGRGEFISMFPDGSLKNKSFSLEGAIDGNQISLKTSVVLGLGLTFSGTADGETLKLIFDAGQLTLVKSDLDTFVQDKLKLAESGAAIVTANKEAKYQADARDNFDRLTSEGRSLEGNLARLPQAETDAENFIAQTKQKRDSIVNQIKVLRAKIQFVSSFESGEIESDIGGLISDLGGLKSDFDANIYSGAAEYDRLQSSLKNFKSHCDQWIKKYATALPLPCKNYQTYLADYQSSRANMKYRFNEAGKMFVFN